MSKKCIVCGDIASFKIKNSSEFYCEECANMQFGDIALLVKVASDATKLKNYLEQEEFKLK